MNEVKLSVERRELHGSPNSRRLRAAGKIPGTVYGMGAAPESVTVERSELRRALSTGAGMNALIRLQVGSESFPTLVKELQRHPVRRDPIHIDFQRIDPETAMQLTVPIVLVGEAKLVTSNGGMVEQRLNALLVSVRPDSIPNEIRYDVSGLELEGVVTVADLALPDGVTTEVDPASPVVMGSLTRAAMVAGKDESEGGAEGEAGEGEGSADAAPSDDADEAGSSDEG